MKYLYYLPASCFLSLASFGVIPNGDALAPPAHEKQGAGEAVGNLSTPETAILPYQLSNYTLKLSRSPQPLWGPYSAIFLYFLYYLIIPICDSFSGRYVSVT